MDGEKNDGKARYVTETVTREFSTFRRCENTQHGTTETRKTTVTEEEEEEEGNGRREERSRL